MNDKYILTQLGDKIISCTKRLLMMERMTKVTNLYSPEIITATGIIATTSSLMVKRNLAMLEAKKTMIMQIKDIKES